MKDRRGVSLAPAAPGLRPTSPRRGEVKNTATSAHLGDENHWSPSPRWGEGWGKGAGSCQSAESHSHVRVDPCPPGPPFTRGERRVVASPSSDREQQNARSATLLSVQSKQGHPRPRVARPGRGSVRRPGSSRNSEGGWAADEPGPRVTTTGPPRPRRTQMTVEKSSASTRPPSWRQPPPDRCACRPLTAPMP